MQVSFIIPLFNQLALTQACVASLRATLPRDFDYEIILVDDGSTDGTREWLATLSEPYRVVLNDRNLGYAGANNRGAAIARGKVFGLLNSDLVFEKPWLEPMLAVLRDLGPRAGLVGNMQLNARTRAVDHTGLRTDLQGRPEHDTSFSSSLSRLIRPVRRVAMLTGACVLIERTLWEQLGGFDEGFRNGGEDVDLCFRAEAAGRINAVALRSVVLHHVSASPGRKIHDEQNSHRLAKKWREKLEHLAHRRWCANYVGRVWAKPETASLQLVTAALLHVLHLRRTPPPAAVSAVHELMNQALARWERLARGERDSTPARAAPVIQISSPVSAARGNRHPTGFTGLFFDDFDPNTAWLRETAELFVPASEISTLLLRGEFKPHPASRGIETSSPSLECSVDNVLVARLEHLTPGPFEITLPIPPAVAMRGARISLTLGGTGLTNALAWLGRVTRLWFWQRFRAQNKNRQIRIGSLVTPEGETIFDFSFRMSPRSTSFALRRSRLEFNVAGYLTADLGVGESARCMIRAADAAGIKTAVVPFKFTCRNTSSDMSFAARFQPDNPYLVNVIHTDPPGTPEVDHYHGASFRAGKYNIAYWAWELPEFPEMWRHFFDYFDEVWSPSHFSASAIAMKTRLPVITMPHAISFSRPTGNHRARFGLPEDKFLFLFLYDLNSYAARKNPQAALAAFRKAALASPSFAKQAALVIKVHSAKDNADDFAKLEASVRDLPGTILIEGTLSRREIYELESACDCFVSLHRSEGFGLAVAECMYLGKPVISTDWSATAEFVNSRNGCPVNFSLTTLQESYGPYEKGQIWADPDIDHAAEWMLRLHADPALAARLGAAARAHIETHYSPGVIGARYRQRLGVIATF